MGFFCCGGGSSSESRNPLKIQISKRSGRSIQDKEPQISTSKRHDQFSGRLLRELSTIQKPKNIKSSQEYVAMVNVGQLDGVNEDKTHVLLKRPTSGKALNWSESRRALEVALQQGSGQFQPHFDGMDEYERLEDRLFKLGLVSYSMEGDGNCQFRAVSWSLYGDQDYHRHVRRKAIEYMQNNKAEFEGFLGQNLSQYVSKMSKVREWGDELTLRAICESYGIVLNIISSEQNNWFLRYIPKKVLVNKEVFLTYISPIHYDAIKRRSALGTLSRKFTLPKRK